MHCTRACYCRVMTQIDRERHKFLHAPDIIFLNSACCFQQGLILHVLMATVLIATKDSCTIPNHKILKMMKNIYLLALIGHCLVFSTQAYAFHPCQQLTSRNGVAFLKNHSELHQVSTSYSEPTVEGNDLSEPSNIQTYVELL
jgi:hypothetical protein